MLDHCIDGLCEHIRSRAHLQDDSEVAQHLQQRLVLDGADPVTDAFGPKLVYGVPYALGSTHLTRMRYGVKAAAHCLSEEGLERPGRSGTLRTTQTKGHNPTIGIGQCQIDGGLSPFQRNTTGDVEHELARNTKVMFAGVESVQHRLEGALPRPEASGVSRRGHGHLRVLNALSALILAELIGVPSKVVETTQSGIKCVVLSNEVVEVGEGPSPVAKPAGDQRADSLGDFDQSEGTDRSFQMYMKVDFRQRPQVSHA